MLDGTNSTAIAGRLPGPEEAQEAEEDEEAEVGRGGSDQRRDSGTRRRRARQRRFRRRRRRGRGVSAFKVGERPYITSADFSDLFAPQAAFGTDLLSKIHATSLTTSAFL